MTRTMKPSPRLSVALLLASVCCSGVASAHGLWIEQTGKTKTLFYGEPAGPKKETFPGKLENIKAPQATAVLKDGARQEAKVTRGANGFDLGVSAPSQSMLAMETTLEVKDGSKSEMGQFKPMYYARFAAAPLVAAKPELKLDVTPTATAGRFTVSFDGRPLKAAAVDLIAPNTWVKSFKTDEQGQIQVQTPWRGQYVIEVIHFDKTPGEYQGKKFEGARHRTMLTFAQPVGEVVSRLTLPKE